MKYFAYCRKSSEGEERQAMSLSLQEAELKRVFGDREDVQIVEFLGEARTAKTPGRPVFDEMLRRIGAGEADGILAWTPDRIARNSIDGGRIIYLLDTGAIRDLKFATYTFENNSQGKFMLQIMFGQSKYYSDALSDNVRLAIRRKIQDGWRPGLAPIGYLNERMTKSIVRDPILFPIVKKIFQLMLTGRYTAKQIAVIARDEWGFRTPVRRKIGGVPLSMSSIYKILSNPFYAGVIEWEGKTYPGRHEPAISLEEFERVRTLLRQPNPPRQKKYRHAFTGLMRCGGCGLRITAEHKVNRYGSRYHYYRCTRPRLGPKCIEPLIEVRHLEAQIASFLRSIVLAPSVANFLTTAFGQSRQQAAFEETDRRRAVAAAILGVRKQISELTSLRIRGLVEDDDFLGRRAALDREILLLTSKLEKPPANGNPIPPHQAVVSFNKYAADWFLEGDDQQKRLIFEIAGSHPTLSGKKLCVEAAIPFLALANFDIRPRGLASHTQQELRTGTRQKADG